MHDEVARRVDEFDYRIGCYSRDRREDGKERDIKNAGQSTSSNSACSCPIVMQQKSLTEETRYSGRESKQRTKSVAGDSLSTVYI